MKRFRPLLTALLGLTLWVQGLAIAAAPVATTPDPASDIAAETTQMPCHGDVAADTTPELAACDCCDGDCDNMTGCVVGTLAGVPAVAVPADAPAHLAVATRGWAAKTAVSPLPLRPPITSRA